MTYHPEHCTLCPRRCGADRTKRVGFCKSGERMKVARAALHFYEEPCISGKEGSGTVFFSGCSLGCVFCQNREISRGDIGKEITGEDLVRIALSLKEQGANNLNLVTPDHYAQEIRSALLPLKDSLGMPIAVNTSSYLSPEQLSYFEGLAHIYIADFKFFSSETAKNYASAPDYPRVCLNAITEMVRQKGKPVYDGRGMMQSGVIVRHLVLPGARKESIALLQELSRRFAPDHIVLSLMSQYTPPAGMTGHLSRRVTTFEYKSVMDVAESLGFSGYFQDRSSASDSYLPDFDLTGV